jgi:hypothetical protein
VVFHPSPWQQRIVERKHVLGVLVIAVAMMEPSSSREILTENDVASQAKIFAVCLVIVIDFGIEPFSKKEKIRG